MADHENTPKRINPLIETLCGVAFFVMLVVFLFTLTRLIAAGIPAEDRAGLVETLVWALLGLLATGLAGAKMASHQNPFDFLNGVLTSLRSFVRR